MAAPPLPVYTALCHYFYPPTICKTIPTKVFTYIDWTIRTKMPLHLCKTSEKSGQKSRKSYNNKTCNNFIARNGPPNYAPNHMDCH